MKPAKNQGRVRYWLRFLLKQKIKWEKKEMNFENDILPEFKELIRYGSDHYPDERYHNFPITERVMKDLVHQNESFRWMQDFVINTYDAQMTFWKEMENNKSVRDNFEQFIVLLKLANPEAAKHFEYITEHLKKDFEEENDEQ